MTRDTGLGIGLAMALPMLIGLIADSIAIGVGAGVVAGVLVALWWPPRRTDERPVGTRATHAGEEQV